MRTHASDGDCGEREEQVKSFRRLAIVMLISITIATFVTLLLVPVLYATCVLDLKVVTWASSPAQVVEVV